MKNWKIFINVSMLIAVVLMASCVHEGGNQSFKQPTKEDLSRAMTLYIQIAYKHLENKDYEKAMSSVKRALDIDKQALTAAVAQAVEVGRVASAPSIDELIDRRVLDLALANLPASVDLVGASWVPLEVLLPLE